ncbi:MAG: hypothetical protein JWN68_1081 [Nocardioides sp.]|jgi:hypothetical protein|uniref:hypothetical protein n=1 Tax=Nocardioides sp. TaxID=35761 RepID=UPI002609DD6F|nr:hypothetical protein [Nocardioides sp.]MCW2833128.1 hypothetical protein [Nocardioides sp.]
MSEAFAAIVVGLALGAVVGFAGYRWGWQTGLGAAILVVLAGLAMVLTDTAALQSVTLGLLACAAVSASATHVGGRKRVT